MLNFFLNKSDLRSLAGATSFQRGATYANNHRVRKIEHDQDSITGQVIGSGRAPYETTIFFDEDGELEDNDCSCPIGGDCKHVVALGLAALQQNPEWFVSQNTPKKPRIIDARVIEKQKPSIIPAWKKALDQLLQPTSPSTNGVPMQVRVLFEWVDETHGKQKTRKRNPVQTLRIRLQLYNSETRRVSLSAIRWSDFESIYSRDHIGQLYNIDPTVLNWLYSIYPHLKTSAWYSHVPDWLDLGQVMHPVNAWRMLGEGQELGIEYIGILEVKKQMRMVIDTEPIRYELCLEQGARNGAQLQPVWKWQDLTLDEENILHLGKDSDQLIAWNHPEAECISLHRTHIPSGIRFDATQSKKAIVIPAEQLVDLAPYLQKIRKHVEIENRTASVVIPDILHPVLVFTIAPEHKKKHAISVLAHWQYGEDKHAMSDVFDDIKHPWRERAEENLIVQAMLAQLNTLPEMGVFELGHFSEKKMLEKMKAVFFLEKVVPILQNLPGVSVVRAEALPVFSRSDEEPEAVFTIDQEKNTSDWFDLSVMISVGDMRVPLGEVITALHHGEQAIFLDDNRFVPLDTPFFQRLAEILRQSAKLPDPQNSTISISRFQAGWWSEFAKLGVIEQQSAAWEQSIQQLISTRHAPPPLPQPKKLLGTLRPYQMEGYAWLSFLRRQHLGGVLADDMGLGKTIQSIACMVEGREAQSLKLKAKRKSLSREFTEPAPCVRMGCAQMGSRREPKIAAVSTPLEGGRGEFTSQKEQGKSISSEQYPFLIVAPTSVVENWDIECQRFAPHLTRIVLRAGDRKDLHANLGKTDIVITSYALLVRDSAVIKMQTWDTIFIDEAQMVKNHQSKSYAILRALSASARIALTGTPLENNVMELWSLFSITCPGLFPSPERFREVYQKPIEKQNDMHVLQDLRHHIRPFILRRKKDLVARDLPAKTEQVLHLPMAKDQRKIYDLFLQKERQRILGLLENGGMQKNRFEVLKSLMRLRQLCLHPALVEAKNATSSSVKIETLLEQLMEILSEQHKVLIFSQFTSFLALIREQLDERGIAYAYLDGSTKDRKTVVDNFQTNPDLRVFLLSLKAGGVGINLTSADYCFILDPWWNPAVESQAVDRTHRIGQTKPVMVYRFIIENSIEEKVLLLQEKKRRLFANVLEEGDLFGTVITENDIRDLLE